jgi:hypothetical protein
MIKSREKKTQRSDVTLTDVHIVVLQKYGEDVPTYQTISASTGS